MSRGRDVSRIEGFSDAVFGFALTLLVASLEVPEDFRVLKQTLTGFLPFAVTFAMVCYIWWIHYSFFRKFGMEDGLTVLLNSVLLFVVLFFVYPLKFTFGNLIPQVTGTGDAQHGGFQNMTPSDVQFLLVAYSSGVVAVFLIFVLLYWNAYRQRATLALAPVEIYDARAGMRAHGISAALGMTSIAMATLLPLNLLGLSGLIYFLEGPFQGLNGYFSGRTRARRFPSSTPARP